MSQAAPELQSTVIVKALHLEQEGLDVYSFFIHGSDITQIADISRVERDSDDNLKGFQRPEIRSHVKNFIEFLNNGQIAFPNAVILALSPEVKFTPSHGPKTIGLKEIAQSGTLTIPIKSEGERVAWIVDGQQRSLALSQCNNKNLPVPAIAFISDELEVQREQFILVNKAKPLPTRLINELLPKTRSILLPKDLSTCKLPSKLCQYLNRDQSSPFHQLIKRSCDKGSATAVITDTAIIRMICNSLSNPLGALAPYKEIGSGTNDIESMYSTLCTFWSAVKDIFPEAWGKDPRQSRLMHSAGIEAMGVIMDRIWASISTNSNSPILLRQILKQMAPHCCWIEGTWEYINVAWNKIRSTPKDIKKLAETLIRIYITRVNL